MEHTNDSGFSCKSIKNISSKELEQIVRFEPIRKEGEGLALYLKRNALDDENNDVMRTYLVKDAVSNELAGYFSLKAGLISLEDEEEFVEDSFPYTIPGIELANFAVNGLYKKNHPESRDLGKLIFSEFIIDLVVDASRIIGVKVLYIFSLPYESLIKNYQKYGFSRLPEKEEDSLHTRLKSRYDKDCIFMYMVL